MAKKFLDGKKLKFMLVDDDKIIREIIGEMLRLNGQEIIEAVDGNDCINKIKTSDKDTDIILLDIRMPGIKVPEILKEVKNNSPKTSVIYLTSVKAFEPSEDDIKQGWKVELESPVIGYIEKPVNKNELLQKIEKFLKKKENKTWQ